MRCLRQLCSIQPFPVSWEVYRVRDRNELPAGDYEAYIFSGGPGDPLEKNKPWCGDFLSLIDGLFEGNEKNGRPPRFAFFICHSFQILCHHLGVAEVCLRKSPAFGIFPVHKTGPFADDPVFGPLPGVFYAVDSRDWQVIGPDEKKLRRLGAEVTALEKIRPHVDYERAVMAARFTPHIAGTQFHPEADATGMQYYFLQEAKKRQIIENHGEEKYKTMMQLLREDDKILRTYVTVVPGFLRQAWTALRGGGVESGKPS
jgi:GMP synthase-like glutamine amidotransferase